MTERVEHQNCTICGDPLYLSEERLNALCEHCTDAWERENESQW